MSEKVKGVNLKESIWERLRNLSYDNRMSIPQFIVSLMDRWEEDQVKKTSPSSCL